MKPKMLNITASKRNKSGTEKVLQKFEQKTIENAPLTSLLGEMEAATHQVELDGAMGKYEEELEKEYSQKLAELEKEFDRKLKKAQKMYEKKYDTILVGSKDDEAEYEDIGDVDPYEIGVLFK